MKCGVQRIIALLSFAAIVLLNFYNNSIIGETAQSNDVESISYDISVNSFTNIAAILTESSEPLFLTSYVKNDGAIKNTISDRTGNQLIEDEYDFCESSNMSTVVFANKNYGSNYTSVVYDCELNKILEHTGNYYIRYHSEIMSSIYDTEKDKLRYMNPDGHIWDLDELYYFKIRLGGDYSKGRAIIEGGNIGDEFGHTYIMNDRELKPVRFPSARYENGTGYGISINESINDDNWLFVVAENSEYRKWAGLKDNFPEFAFYNIKTEKLVPYLYPDYSWGTIDEGGGYGFLTYNGLALDKRYSDGSTDEFRIYDIERGAYVNDEYYLYCGLNEFGFSDNLALVQFSNGKWGWIDSNYHQFGKQFDDASGFRGGYALVNIEGEEYIINRNMDIISYAIPGSSALALTEDDNHIYFAIGGYSPGPNNMVILTIHKSDW